MAVTYKKTISSDNRLEYDKRSTVRKGWHKP